MNLPEGEEKPNLVARKISLRLPVRLNLHWRYWVMTRADRLSEVYSPFSDEFFRVAVGVRRVPEVAAALVHIIQELFWTQAQSTMILALDVKILPSTAPRRFPQHHTTQKAPWHHIQGQRLLHLRSFE